MVYEITDENEIKLLHFSNLPFDENDINSCEGTASFRPVEVLLSGLNRPGERHGTKYTYTAPGYRLKYKDMKDYRNETGRKLEILMEDKPTYIMSHTRQKVRFCCIGFFLSPDRLLKLLILLFKF